MKVTTERYYKAAMHGDEESVRPHGIKYHPDVVLDVIYEDKEKEELVQQSHSKSHRFSKSKAIASSSLTSKRKNKEEGSLTQTTPNSADPQTQQSRNQRLIQMDREMNISRVLDDYMAAAAAEERDDSNSDEVKENQKEFEREEEGNETDDGNQIRYNGDNNNNTNLSESAKPNYLVDDIGSPNTTLVDQEFMKAINAIHRVEVRAKTALDLADTVSGGELAIGNLESKNGTAAKGEGEATMADLESEDYDENEEEDNKFEGLDGIVKMRESIYEYMDDESYSTCSDESLDLNEFTIRNLVRKRASLILNQQYSWIEAENPKLFIILPVDHEVFGDPDHQADDAYIKSLKWSDFALHVLCDCGNIPGYESIYYPHLNIKNCPRGHAISKKVETSVLKKFGFYLLATLEAFKYGLHIRGERDEDDIIVPAVADTGLWKAMSASINFLSYQNFFGSELMWMMSGKEKDLAEISAVDPLSKEDLASLGVLLSETRWSNPDVQPVLISSGRVRWMCEEHYIGLSSQEEVAKARSFSNNPASLVSDYMYSMGAFRSVVKSPERARDFYQLAQKLTTTCILRLFLDWDLTTDDIKELCQAVSKFPAACVRLQVRSSSKNGGTIPGFEHAYPDVIFEALRNPKIEAFILNQGEKDELTTHGFNEWQEVQHAIEMSGSLALFKKNRVTDKIDLRLLVSDIDHAVIAVRKVVKGLHHFSKLALIISDNWDHVYIRFQSPSEPGGDIIDTDYESDDFLEFFDKRNNLDSVIYKLRNTNHSRFVKSKVLRGITTGYVHSKDRTKIRDMLKNNKRLLAISLDSPSSDDPSQIYEYHKNLLSTHLNLGTLEIRQRHGDQVSEFIWNAVSNPLRMNISITTHAGDKLASMLQKYASSVKYLYVFGISISDAALLDRVLGPKRGPIKLEKIILYDLHKIDPVAIESLRKVIMRWEHLRVKINSNAVTADDSKGGGDHGTLNADGSGSGGRGKNKTKQSEKAKRLEQEAIAKGMVRTADFIYTTAPKIIGISGLDSGCRLILEELGTRGPRASILPPLTSLILTGSGKPLLEYKWIVELLFFKSIQFRQHLKTHAGTTTTTQSTEVNSSSSSKESQEQGGEAQATGTKMMMRPALYLEPEKVDPIRDLSLIDFQFRDNDISYFLESVNFTEMISCQLEITNEMSGATLLSIAAAMPNNNLLESFSISVPGPSREDSLRCQKLIKQKCSRLRPGKSCVVMINGHVA
ncbi:hypothetical protein BGZ76_001535 [Entomortierella beljakovae]|nr:hypothetical protein BGZ76_001535 [Entomortierella beljakovae]